MKTIYYKRQNNCLFIYQKNSKINCYNVFRCPGWYHKRRRITARFILTRGIFELLIHPKELNLLIKNGILIKANLGELC